MDHAQFLHDRLPVWRRLTELLDRADRRGLRSLAPREVEELFTLYRLASSDLNLLQTRKGNPALLEHLEGLVGRAYTNISVPRQVRFLSTWWNILRHQFPAAIRSERTLFFLATAVLLAGTIFGFAATLASPENAEVFLPAEHLAQSPSERVAQLEKIEREGAPRITSIGGNAAFGTFLFTHNIRVSVLCFAFGFTFGVGTIALLFYNGAMLGSLAALYWKDHVFTFFIAWVGPHGAIELPCILFGATAGLLASRAQFRRDSGPILSQLRALRPRMLHLLVGTASLLVLAGTIEGGFSNVNEPTLPYPLKIAVATALLAALVTYLFWLPVTTTAEVEDTGETPIPRAVTRAVVL